MTATDRPAFALLMSALCSAFGRSQDSATLEAYWMGLEDLDLLVLKEAVYMAIRGERRQPPPAILRELADEAERQMKAEAERRAAEALTAARMACSECCSEHRKPCMEHGDDRSRGIACRACRFLPGLCEEHAATLAAWHERMSGMSRRQG